MIDFSKINLDTKQFEKIVKLVEKNQQTNEGCQLHNHWEKFSQANFDNIVEAEGKFAAMSWLGHGYPEKTSERSNQTDRFGLASEFVDLDTLDIQSGLYQFYKIVNFFKNNDLAFLKSKGIKVIEVGGGYGRLAMFFLKYFGIKCHYVSVDFVPTSLAFAPQVIEQSFPEMKVLGTLAPKAKGKKIEDYNFVSLPAWEIDKLKDETYDLAINIHSFQEMLKPSFKFYTEQFSRLLKPEGVFYNINNPPDTGNGYAEQAWYELEDFFVTKSKETYPFGDDWVKICGVPTLERFLTKK